MVIKVYISGISGNHEIRKQQQRVLFILSSLKIDFEVIDITEIGKENEREFMQTQCKLHGKEKTLPPQIFHEDTYCGDFDDFEGSNEDDLLMDFLKLGSGKIPHNMCGGNIETASPVLSNVEAEGEALKA